MKKYALQINTSFSVKPKWEMLYGEEFDTLEEAKAALEAKGSFKPGYRIVEAYTVVRYKPVKEGK